MSRTEPRCPGCGSDAVYDLTCHTYPSGTYPDGRVRMMSCLPCDSAIEYRCTNGDCPWYYVDGLNKKNPRSEANEARRPAWLEGHELWVSTGFGGHVTSLPGVQAAWDYDDEADE